MDLDQDGYNRAKKAYLSGSLEFIPCRQLLIKSGMSATASQYQVKRWANELRGVSQGCIGLLWLDDNFKVIDQYGFEEIGKYPPKGVDMTIDVTHDEIKPGSSAWNRSRVEVFNGVVTIGIGEKASVADILAIKDYMGWDKLKKPMWTEDQFSEWDAKKPETKQ
ncbi:MAG: hypothetical protein LBI03_06215 [Clostridiales bacterium]|jgi:hypothetical protein|nr:hypothetical protein [Clostridiales bacterium]